MMAGGDGGAAMTLALTAKELAWKNTLLQRAVDLAHKRDWEALEVLLAPYYGQSMATIGLPPVYSPRHGQAQHQQFSFPSTVQTPYTELVNAAWPDDVPTDTPRLASSHSLDSIPEGAASSAADSSMDTVWPEDVALAQFLNPARAASSPKFSTALSPVNEEDEDIAEFKVGDEVVVLQPTLASNSAVANRAEAAGIFKGKIRFMGHVGFADGMWAGIELNNTKVGRNDGSFRGRRYFHTKAHNGIFLRPAVMRLAPRNYARAARPRPKLFSVVDALCNKHKPVRPHATAVPVAGAGAGAGAGITRLSAKQPAKRSVYKQQPGAAALAAARAASSRRSARGGGGHNAAHTARMYAFQ